MTDPQELMQTLAEQLRALGIPVSTRIDPQVQINTRAKARLGCCIRRGERFTIEVSATILQDEPCLRQTLVHELLHTCPDCQNHGTKWKQYAQWVNHAWGMGIARLTSMPAGQSTKKPPRYTLRCSGCGALFYRERRCLLVQYPQRYRCACGGSLQLVSSDGATP